MGFRGIRFAKEVFREMEDRAGSVLEQKSYAELARKVKEIEHTELADICPELLDRIVSALGEALADYEAHNFPESILWRLQRLCAELSKLSEQRWSLENA
jgi:hypothetical protein